MSLEEPKDLNYHQIASNLILAMLANADPEKIGGLNWWPRARAALQSASARATSFPEMVAVMGHKLQVIVLSQKTAQKVSTIGTQIENVFEKFRHICERDSLYIIAEAQAIRNEQKELEAQKKEEEKNKKKNTEPVNIIKENILRPKKKKRKKKVIKKG